MLNIPHPVRTLAPLAAKYGMQAIGVPGSVFESETEANELNAFVRDLGLGWGLLPMPADFYHWDLDATAFENALTELFARFS